MIKVATTLEITDGLLVGQDGSKQSAVAVRPAELDVVMDRVIVAREHLEGGEMRLGHGAARAAIHLADLQVIEAAPFGHVVCFWIELRHARPSLPLSLAAS